MSEYITVTKLNQYIKSIVESDFSLNNITLVGEVISLTKHFSGHFYFTLKDEESSIRCMMFATYAQKLNFEFKNGDQILVKGYVGVYEKNGSYQFYCRSAEPFGEGQYLIQLAKLKEKLEKEGLFSKPKKPLPMLPRKVGLITAKTGAAIHDFFSTMLRRTPCETYIFPSLVQGEDAPKSIIEAINLSKNFDLDILVITRGGGSKEDLRCFNDEALIREAATLNIPLVVAIGHQIDTTLIDYVSDYSFITPTDVASNIFPDYNELNEHIDSLKRRELFALRRRLNEVTKHLIYLKNITESHSPSKKIELYIEKTNTLYKRIQQNILYQTCKKVNLLYKLEKELKQNTQLKLQAYHNRLQRLESKLSSLNPYLHLKKGFAFVESKDGKIITSVDDISINEEIVLQLKDGNVSAIITKKGK